MKKKSLFITILFFSFIILICGTILPEISQAKSEVYVGNNTNHDIKHLNKMDMIVDIPTETAKIDSSLAVQNAKLIYPFVENATDIKIEYHLLTNKSFKLFSEEALSKIPDLKAKNSIERLPVYIISFEGVSVPTPSGKKDAQISNIDGEFNVVVDSTNGIPLYAFSYR